MAPRFPIALSFLLLASSAFASIQSSVAREVTPRTIDLAASDQSGARIASDGWSFLTVWVDAPGTILGARLGADGTLIDTTPLTIGEADSDERQPAIAWGNGRYLVVWQTDDSFRGRFVAQDGALSPVLELGPRALQAGETHVAFNGRVFLVMGFVRDLYFHATIVDRLGTILASRNDVVVGFNSLGDLVATRDAFHFVASSGGNVLAVPIDESARGGTPMILGHANNVVAVRAAARENEFVAAWWYSENAADKFAAVRVTAGGAGTVETFTGGGRNHDVVADGSGYLLIYGSNPILARRFDGGTPFALRMPDADSFTQEEDAASNGAQTISLLRRPDLGGDVFATVVGEDVLTPVALAPRDQRFPAIAAAGELRLAVWREHLTAERRYAILGVRIDADGKVLDPTPIEIAAAGPSTIRIASNGTDWLAIWQLEGRLHGVRVRHDGTLADPTPLVLAEQATPLSHAISVAWDGTSYVAVYESGAYLAPQGWFLTVYAAHVPATGPHVTVNPATAIHIHSNGYIPNPSIASGPNGSLIVWNGPDLRVRGALLSQGNTVTPVLFPIETSARRAVAWNGDTFLVAGVSSDRTLRLSRVDANGTMRPSYATIPLASADATVDVEPFGDAFLLVWEDGGALWAAMINREGFIAEPPALIGPVSGSFAAAGAQVVTQQSIEHPTHPSRVFVQSLQWTPESNPKRRAARF